MADNPHIFVPSDYVCTIHNSRECRNGFLPSITLDREHEQLGKECREVDFLGTNLLIHESFYTDGVLSSTLLIYPCFYRGEIIRLTIVSSPYYTGGLNINLIIGNKIYNWWGYKDGVCQYESFTRGAKKEDINIQEIIVPILFMYEGTTK